MATLQPYVTTKEAATMAGITPETLRKYVHEGRAPQPLRTGTGLFDRAEIVAWIASRPGRGFRSDLHGVDHA